MPTAVIAEKPSLAQLVLPSVNAGEDRVLGYTNPFVSLNSNFDYPRGLRWADYPLVRDVRYKVGGVILRKAGVLAEADEGLVAEIRACRQVILIRDPSSSSALAFQLALGRLYPDGVPPETVFDIAPASYRPESVGVYAADGMRVPLPACGLDPGTYGPAEIKRRFDYNFNLNAFAVLGELMRAVGASGSAVTKVGLQALYMCRDAGPLDVGTLLQTMQMWKGTGRYVDKWVQLGSPSSQAGTIYHLREVGLLDSEDEGHRSLWSVSERGRRFLDLLHPGCRDPDLPFRIEEWSRLSREEAYAKVDRYIRTFFGRQKRFTRDHVRGRAT